MTTRRRGAAALVPAAFARAARVVATTLAATLLATGCASSPERTPVWQSGASTSPDTTDKSEKPDAGGDAAGEVVVPETLKFTGTTLDGAAFDARTLAGKPALLWFWAPWCATCASEAMSISDIAGRYRGQLGILGIAGMGTNKAMHEFVSDLEVGAVPHLDDQAGKIWKRFKITEQSLYVVLDRTGRVVHTGYLDDLQLTAQVKSLVG